MTLDELKKLAESGGREFWIAPEESDAHGLIGCNVYTDFNQIPDEFKKHSAHLTEKSHADKLSRALRVLCEVVQRQERKINSVIEYFEDFDCDDHCEPNNHAIECNFLSSLKDDDTAKLLSSLSATSATSTGTGRSRINDERRSPKSN